jgi:hypothetical protein
MTDTTSAAPSEREQFEAWMANRLGPAGAAHPFLTHASDGYYTFAATQEQWEAWQAARRTQPTPPAVVEPLTEEQADRAARKMADIMDYPWDYMLEQGRNQMREHG